MTNRTVSKINHRLTRRHRRKPSSRRRYDYTADWSWASYNTITDETKLKEVTATFALESDHINYITIEDEHGNIHTLEVTDVHPFWVVTDEPDLERAARAVVDENGVTLYHHNIAPTENGFWVEANDLRVGDVFLGANGELTTVVAIERVDYRQGVGVIVCR